jgi:hypothetical protein
MEPYISGNQRDVRMSERSDLLASIANTIKTYRAGEIPIPTPEHVDRWASQFTTANQLPLLREFAFVVDNSFVTRDNVVDFLRHLVMNTKLAGADPREYWSKTNFLSVQKDGVSQVEMLKLLDECLQQQLNLKLADCGDPSGDYIYLDDMMCTGSRVASDIEAWIANEAPATANVQVILVVMHTSASDYLQRVRLKQAIQQSGKAIKIHYWRALEIENQKANRNNSGVYWPVALPGDQATQEYAAAQKFPFVGRDPGGKSQFFSSEAGRQVLESEFLLAGMKIRSQHVTPKPVLKPLGFGGFGVGFGSTLATYRNCPNNSPLAIWWGEGAKSGALQWYPLLPRKTYSSPENVFRAFKLSR